MLINENPHGSFSRVMPQNSTFCFAYSSKNLNFKIKQNLLQSQIFCICPIVAVIAIHQLPFHWATPGHVAGFFHPPRGWPVKCKFDYLARIRQNFFHFFFQFTKDLKQVENPGPPFVEQSKCVGSKNRINKNQSVTLSSKSSMANAKFFMSKSSWMSA